MVQPDDLISLCRAALMLLGVKEIIRPKAGIVYVVNNLSNTP
jgi:hypothetical protein